MHSNEKIRMSIHSNVNSIECQFIRMLVSKRFKTVSNAFFLFGVTILSSKHVIFERMKNAVVTENSKDSPPENQGENIGKLFWIYVFFFLKAAGFL